jgi:hypothetical protein
MSKRITEVTPPIPESGNHTRIETWGGDGFHDRYFRFDARRVVCDGNDEAQIEVQVSQTAKGKNRTATIYGSIVLTPEEARALAIAICPELAQ